MISDDKRGSFFPETSSICPELNKDYLENSNLNQAHVPGFIDPRILKNGKSFCRRLRSDLTTEPVASLVFVKVVIMLASKQMFPYESASDRE